MIKKIKAKINKAAVKKMSTDMVFLIVASAIGSFSLTSVMVPNGLTCGGLSGIIRIIQYFFPFNFAILYYGGAIIIFLAATLFLGVKESRKILMLTILYPAILVLFEHLDFNLLEEKDVILAAIFCGVFFGVCSGLIFWRGYAFCGTDAIAKIIRKKFFPNVPLSQILLVLDATIIIFSAFIYGRNIALYALVTQVIFTKTVDFILYGFETKIVQLEIITKYTDEVSNYIMHDIGRGVSVITITGAYTKTEYKKLITLCSPRESMLIKKYVAGLDKRAFVTVLQVGTVWGQGEGFNDIDVE